jgi:hypothetical protein
LVGSAAQPANFGGQDPNLESRERYFFFQCVTNDYGFANTIHIKLLLGIFLYFQPFPYRSGLEKVKKSLNKVKNVFFYLHICLVRCNKP